MMNYYEPKFLRGVLEQSNPLRLFFRNKFFSESITFPGETVSFEFARDSRRLLPYVNEYAGSAAVSREGYQLKTYRAPLLSGSRTITNDTLAQKSLGESEWEGKSPEERARDIALMYIMNLQDALYRKQEYMCARVKQDGVLNITGDGINAVVDYGFKNISDESSNQWTDSYDIFSKLWEKASVLMQSGIVPDMIILGYKASKALMTSKQYMKLRHDNLVVYEPDPEDKTYGVHYMGTMYTPYLPLRVYQYLESYEDAADGKTKPLIDDGTVIMQSSQERNMMLYGAVTYIGNDDEYHSAMSEYVSYVVTEKDPPKKKLILSSRCLPMPVDIESWYVMKNVA